MSEYYGVASTPTEDFIAHYGIKGMKWGVRRAVQKNNAKILARQYAKARKKLDRLNSAADITTNERRIAKNKKIAGIAGGIGVAGAAGAVNQHLKDQHLLNNLRNLKKKHEATTSYSYYNKMDDAYANDDYDAYQALQNVQDTNRKNYYNASRDYDRRESNINANKWISAGIGAAGLGTAAVAGGRAALAKYRTTKKGHAKAVAKRDAFQNEMVKVFNDDKVRKLTAQAYPQIRKSADASVRRSIQEKVKNDKFIKDLANKQAKKRARLERKIGKLL